MTLSGLHKGAARCAAWLLLLAGFLLPAPQSAFAHAKLLRSEPKADSKLPQPPKAVELWFSEELEVGFNAIEVKDAQGNRVYRGEVTLAEGGKKAQVELQDLPAGAYTVEWKALSSDGHTLRGKFAFTVEASAAPAAAEATPTTPAGGQQQATPVQLGGQVGAPTEGAAGEEGSAVTATDSLVRWLGYLAMMTLLGGFASLLFVLGPALREAGDGDPDITGNAVSAASRRSLQLFWLSIAALAVSLLLALVFQSAAVHGVGIGEALAPSRLGRVIAGTGYGTSWLIQTAGAAALVLVVALLGRTVRRDPEVEHKGLWTAGLAASALLMLGPSLTGHAAVAVKHFPLATVSDWLHLAAGGMWVGGLFHLALTLPPALGRLEGGLRTRALSRVITLFTKLALPSVAVLAFAGVYNAYAHLGSLRALWATPYGRTLSAKVLLVLAMLILGWLNGYRFGTSAGRLARDEGDEAGRAEVERGFGRSVKVEATLGVLVLLVTAFLVFVSPGRNHPAMDAAGGVRHPSVTQEK
jgi:copper transport protein